MEDHVVLTTNLLGPGQVEKLNGRDHRVVPAVLVRSGIVLNNNLGRTVLMAEDVTEAWAEAWNGAPVVTDHPSRRGAAMSARDPDTLNAMGVGAVFRARAEDGDLKADVFLDLARQDELPHLKAILGKLDAGEKVELSTGFPVEVETAPGKAANGEEFDVVLRPRGADHLAVFATKTGACSVTDGCGLAANHEGEYDAPPPELPVHARKDPAWRRFIKGALAAFGWGPADNESDEDRMELLRATLQEKFGAAGARVWIAATYTDEGAVVFERWNEEAGDVGLFRVAFEIDDSGKVTLGEEAVEVRRVTSFEPVAMGATAGTTSNGEGTMNREKMIAHLAEAGTDRAALDKLSDCQIKALYEAANPPAPPQEKEIPADAREAMRIAHQYRDEAVQLRQKFGQAQNAIERRRAEQLDDLLYHSRDLPYSADELHAMNAEQVEKVHRLAFPQRSSYVGLGGPRGNDAPMSGGFEFARQGILVGNGGHGSVFDGEKGVN